jgi:hypothetical protein
VSDNLAVRLGFEPVPPLQELRPKLDVVLDDAVVDDRDPPRAVEMRM